MKNTNWRLKLYNATWYRFHFYISSLLVLVIAFSIVAISKNIFWQSDGHTIIVLSFVLFVIGRILTVYKETVEKNLSPWKLAVEATGWIFFWLYVFN